MIKKEMFLLVLALIFLSTVFNSSQESAINITNDTNITLPVITEQTQESNNKINITILKNALKECRTEKNSFYQEIREMRKDGHLKMNPDTKEVLSFLRKDDTDKKEYIKGKFVCVDFANTLINNMVSNGLYACYTYIEFDNGTKSHAIVAVNTNDNGIIYIEPQTDDIIYDLKSGDDYCQKTGWYCNWIINKISTCFEPEEV